MDHPENEHLSKLYEGFVGGLCECHLRWHYDRLDAHARYQILAKTLEIRHILTLAAMTTSIQSQNR